MVKIVQANTKEQRNCFQGILQLLCWLKVIPVQKDSYTYSILSLPSFLATFWFWVPFTSLSYNFYNIFTQDVHVNSVNNITTYNNVTNANLNQAASAIKFRMAEYVYPAFMTMTVLLILLLPGTLGHFYSFNGFAMRKLRFSWPRRGWMAVCSAISIILGETMAFLIYHNFGIFSTTALTNFITAEVSIVTAAFLQLTALILVEVRHTDFVREAAAKKSMTITVDTIQNLLDDYECMLQGLGPLYTLLFCIHTPIIICFTYYVFAFFSYERTGSVVWSCLALIQICLMSEDCYDAVQVGTKLAVNKK
jgi:hypothetical protein